MQRQAMGVVLHIVLLPVCELLHSTVNSSDTGPRAGFFYAGLFSKAFLRLKYVPQQEKAMQAIHASEPIPTDPVPIPEPVPQPQPIPEPEPPHDPDVPPISDPPPHQ
jgi:hypothetical protein